MLGVATASQTALQMVVTCLCVLARGFLMLLDPRVQGMLQKNQCPPVAIKYFLVSCIYTYHLIAINS